MCNSPIRDPDEYAKTEVTELQILREHSEFLTTFAVFEDTIYSSCADGQILCHVFPKVSANTITAQGAPKECFQGLANFDTALAYHICLVSPTAFTH